jgi:hypothetical protein
MSLSDNLKKQAQESPDARRKRESHPKGYEPGISKFHEPGVPAEVSLRLSVIPESEEKWRDEIKRVTNMDIPQDRKVELTGVRYWGDPSSPYVYCRFAISDRAMEPDSLDVVKLLGDLRTSRNGSNKQKAPKRVQRSDSRVVGAFVISWNDWQTGKKGADGRGTDALAERLDRAYDSTVARIKELRKIGRDIGKLVVVGGADMVEGCAIFPNQPYELDSDRRTQFRNTVALGLEGLDRLVPLFESTDVLVVGGNHGENRINGQRTTRTDNDDCRVFEMMREACERDKNLNHITWTIAQGEPAKTIEVAGWILGTTHGHVYGKTSAGSIEQKAYKWFMGQAAGRQPVGDSDVFITHHFHHYAARDWGATQWVQTPAMDGGSEWLTDLNGQSSQPGMLSFVMTPENRFQDMQILS